MKKLKKYIYPPIFSVVFLAYWFALSAVINAMPMGDSGYAGLGLAMLLLFLWIFVIIPIYCIRYSKLVIDGKFKFLFPVYNSALIIVSHLLPFGNFHRYLNFVIGCFAWVIFWNILPLAMRIIARKNKDNILKKDDAHLTNLLLQNKKKNIIVIIITCLYIISVIKNFFYYSSSHLSHILSLTSAVVFLVLILSKNKEYYFKKWLLSFALLGELASFLVPICKSLNNMEFQMEHNPLFPITFALSCLTVVLAAVMFISSLFNFKYIKLFKYSALGCAFLAIVKFIFNLVNVVQTAYNLIDINGKFYISTEHVIILVLNAAYVIGIYILTTNKELQQPQAKQFIDFQ